TRTGLGGRGRLHSHRPATDRPAPRHSLGCAPTTGAEEQAELFTGDQRRQGSAETLSEPSA
ncbi:MAG TPA: hypothetical protein VF755_06620, partial [Catenuloplanes sp.]